MLVGICCSRAARDRAAALAERLERNLGVGTLIVAEDEPVCATWEQAALTNVLIVLLDRAGTPPRVSREDWQALLDHATEPPVAFVRLEPCPYPALLERRKFHAAGEWLEVERWVERRVVEHMPRTGEPAIVRGPAFPAEWWVQSVDRPGVCRGETGAMADEFAHQVQRQFQGVWRIRAAFRPWEATLGEIEFRGRQASRLLMLVTDAPHDVEAPAVGRHSLVLSNEGLSAPEPRGIGDLQALNRLFQKWRAQPELCHDAAADVPEALAAGWEARDGAALSLAWNFGRYLLDQQRTREGIVWLRLLEAQADSQGDSERAELARRELLWVTDDAGLMRDARPVGDQLEFDF